MKRILLMGVLIVLACASCRDTRIKEHNGWKQYFDKYGIQNGCFIMTDHTHEAVHLYNKDRCLQRFLPASTFKIFNSLVALETATAQDETLLIPWDSIRRGPQWDKSMTMKEAFKTSNIGYYQELARRIGAQDMQHFLDTVKYGNMKMGKHVDSFWVDNSLQISADEQVGFLKRLYFEQLPFTLRTQTIVRSIMLQQDSADNKLYYKTGWGHLPNGKDILWVVGFLEHSEEFKEHKNSMNKSDRRNYPYIFALNFEINRNDQSRNWMEARINLLNDLLNDFGAYKTP